MIDFGHSLRQKFIADSATLEAKRNELRERLHRENKALVGEEVAAKKNGWSVFKPQRGWGK